MNAQPILGVALVAQLGLIALTWWPSTPTSPPARPLLDAADAVIGLHITSGPDTDPVEEVHLQATDDGWALTTLGGYPASADNVREVLEPLEDVRLRRVVARSPDRHADLGVAADAFDKRVELELSDGRTVGFLVSPARSKALHLRLDGEDEVYEVRGLSAWSLRNQPRAYFDRKLFDASAEQLTSLSLTRPDGSWTFERSTPEGPWELTEPLPPEGTTLDQDVVNGLAADVLSPRLSDPVGPTPAPDQGLDGQWAVAWTSTDGAHDGYTLGDEVDGKRFLQLDANGFVVQTVTTRLDDLFATTLDDLLRPAEPLPDEAPAASP